MTAIEGEGLPVTIVVSVFPQGMYTIDYEHQGRAARVQGGSLESVIGKAAGANVPENYVLHTAAVLRGIFQKAKVQT